MNFCFILEEDKRFRVADFLVVAQQKLPSIKILIETLEQSGFPEIAKLVKDADEDQPEVPGGKPETSAVSPPEWPPNNQFVSLAKMFSEPQETTPPQPAPRIVINVLQDLYDSVKRKPEICTPLDSREIAFLKPKLGVPKILGLQILVF